MEEEKVGESEVIAVAEAIKKKKKTQNFKSHIAVREETLKDFREMKDEPGSDAFLKKLLRLYKKFLKHKEKKNEEQTADL